MKRLKISIISLTAVLSLMPVSAFALEDGWYRVTDFGGCSQAQSAVIYVEGDVPLSISVGEGSGQVEEHKKISAMKANFVFSSGSERATAAIWKNKANQIVLKVVQANSCIGAEIKFTK